MKKLSCALALLVFVALTPSCSFDVFEDVGSDPHPPGITMTALKHYVAPAATPALAPSLDLASDRATAPSHGRSIFWDSGGFSLARGQKFQIAITYSDAGGDIVKLVLRDRDGALKQEFAPTDQTYFTGTSGTSLGPTDGIELVGVAGRHRLEFWAEDSHLSRSEKVEFFINLAL